MAQVSTLDTSQNPTQSVCQQYIRTNNKSSICGSSNNTRKIEIQIWWNIMSMIKIKGISQIKSNMTDYGKRSSIIKQKQANCGENGAVPSNLLQMKAGVMLNKWRDLIVKSRGDMNGMESRSTAPCWRENVLGKHPHVNFSTGFFFFPLWKRKHRRHAKASPPTNA